ncbi:MAG TPA: hypothetical protein VFH69_06045, partial [Gemmatimonadota bacterium]|nr:hypothetical protein [Gemmatimonadota bacterium]
TLAQVQAAIVGGLEVRVEADGQIVGGAFEVTSVKFESDEADGPGDDEDDDDDDDDDDEDDPDEIHGIVGEVDLAARTVTLADGRVMRVANDALIEVDGDFLTLAGVLAAVGGGLEVRLEADGEIVGGVFEVTSVKFESDEADGPGDDDDDADDDDNSGPGHGDDDDGDDDDNSGPGHGDDDDGDDDNSGPGHGDGD